MKRFLLTFLLGITGSSLFAHDLCEEGQCYSAEIDSSEFQLRSYWPVNAMIYRQQPSLDGRRPARTVISIMMNGESYMVGEKQFNESIQFEIAYEEDKTGEPSLYTVSMQYQSAVYSIIRDTGAFTITEFTWAPDRRSFRLSVEANCRMYAWGYPLNEKYEKHLKAKLSNILVTVPVWIAITQK